MLVTGINPQQFKELPHTRWSVRGRREVKIDGTVVAIMDRGVCSAIWCKSAREAQRVFKLWLYGER